MNEAATDIATNSVIDFRHAAFTYENGADGLHETTIAFDAGQVIVLCGASGCGKTTMTRLINALAPQYFPGMLNGSVIVAGKDTRNTDIAALAQHVGSVFQNPDSQFFTMNVKDELAFACENMAMPPDVIRERVRSTARDFSLTGLLDRPLADMSGGQRQRVACAAVSAARPPIVVLDEPTSNLDATAINALRGIVARWKRDGRTVVIAEHRLAWLDGLVDTAVLLGDGRVLRQFTGRQWHDLTDDERRQLGLRPVTLQQLRDIRVSHHPRKPQFQAKPLTQTPLRQSERVEQNHGSLPAYHVNDLRYRYRHTRRDALDIADMAIPCGAVTTVIGLNGAGKSTFARCLQGLDRRCRGALVTPDGTRLQARQRLDTCITVLQDVNRELFTESVLAEVMLSQPRENEQSALEILDSLGLRELAGRHPMSLSGGQKQRVAIAVAIASERPIIIVDEPTSGLDLHHMHEVSSLIRGLAERGRTVVAITHDPEFALEVSDYVARLVDGRLADWYPVTEPGGTAKLVDALAPNPTAPGSRISASGS